MKIFFFLIIISFSFLSGAKPSPLKTKLDTLKKQTVSIHNDILKNNKELKKIKIDIERNSQKQIILKKRIKSGENVGRRLMFLLQERIYLSPATKIINSLFFQSEDFITEQIVREFFLKEAKTSINTYLESIDGIEEIKKELDGKIIVFEKKKKNLRKKLKILEKKMKEVSKLQKKVNFFNAVCQSLIA